MPRGGKRPGAGAPKGNFNALKHGRRSAQFAQLGAAIAINPKTREAILNFARRLDGKQESAIQGAIELHARIIEEARKIARGEPSPLERVLLGGKTTGIPRARRLSVQSHDADRRSIIEKDSLATRIQHGCQPQRKNRRSHNQKANAVPPNNQTPNTRTPQKPID